MKKIFYCLCLLTLISCKKNEDSQPLYYFRFQVDGVQYGYEYECESGFFGGSCSMGAGYSSSSSITSNFQMYGYNSKERTKEGLIQFDIDKDDFKDLDTIYIDGSKNIITVRKLFTESEFYNPIPSAVSRVIFTRKGDDLVEGFFELDAVLRGGGDTLRIRNGAFSIKMRKR